MKRLIKKHQNPSGVLNITTYIDPKFNAEEYHDAKIEPANRSWMRRKSDELVGSVGSQLSGEKPISLPLATAGAAATIGMLTPLGRGVMSAPGIIRGIAQLGSNFGNLAKIFTKGAILGSGVDGATYLTTGKDWGEFTGDLLDINPTIAAFTNPGYSKAGKSWRKGFNNIVRNIKQIPYYLKPTVKNITGSNIPTTVVSPSSVTYGGRTESLRPRIEAKKHGGPICDFKRKYQVGGLVRKAAGAVTNKGMQRIAERATELPVLQRLVGHFDNFRNWFGNPARQEVLDNTSLSLAEQGLKQPVWSEFIAEDPEMMELIGKDPAASTAYLDMIASIDGRKLLGSRPEPIVPPLRAAETPVTVPTLVPKTNQTSAIPVGSIIERNGKKYEVLEGHKIRPYFGDAQADPNIRVITPIQQQVTETTTYTPDQGAVKVVETSYKVKPEDKFDDDLHLQSITKQRINKDLKNEETVQNASKPKRGRPEGLSNQKKFELIRENNRLTSQQEKEYVNLHRRQWKWQNFNGDPKVKEQQLQIVKKDYMAFIKRIIDENSDFLENIH